MCPRYYIYDYITTHAGTAVVSTGEVGDFSEFIYLLLKISSISLTKPAAEVTILCSTCQGAGGHGLDL